MVILSDDTFGLFMIHCLILVQLVPLKTDRRNFAVVARSVLDLGDLRDLGAWQGPVERMERMEGFRAPLPHCDLRPGNWQPRRMHQVAGLAVPHRFHLVPPRFMFHLSEIWSFGAWQHGSSGPLTLKYIDRVNET